MNQPSDNVVPFPRERARGAAPEDVAALRDALRGLRSEIDARFAPRSEPGVESEAESFDWIELFDELRRRAGSFGMSERSGEVDEFGLDVMTLVRARPLLDFLVDRYWRVELAGAEHLGGTQPVLLVGNRSGLLPWDGLVLAHCIQRERPDWYRPRFLVADWLITLPFAQPLLARLGGVRACRENTDRLLRRGKSVIAFPEGVKGAAKDFRLRYRLQRFGRGGAVRAAIENGVPLVPVGIVGAEEVHPILYKSRTAGRAVGLPFLPVTPTFPALGPLGLLPLPSKWTIEIGEPLAFDALDPESAADELFVSRMNEELRTRIRALVTRGLARRGGARD
ncbi:MAG: lysophospholipid acyltransferase family protein [Myxococcota bacterium]|nr:acyltransferase family protein [Myxococcales bacterium]